MSRLSVLLVCTIVVALLSLTLLSSSSSIFVDASKPSLPCDCGNGAVRNTTETKYCLCQGCVSPNVLPTCTFKNTDRVKFIILYRNNTGDVFSMDKAESKIQRQFGVDGNTVKWVQRAPRYEKDITEVAVVYLLTGSIVASIMSDVYTVPLPTYLQNPEAIDMWEVGKIIAPASVFSQHYAGGNVLGSFAYSGHTIEINDRYLEFFIGAIAVTLFCAIIEGVLFCIFHPSKEDLDAQQEKWADADDDGHNNKKAARGVDGSIVSHDEFEMQEQKRRAQQQHQHQQDQHYGYGLTPKPTTPPPHNIAPVVNVNPLTAERRQSHTDYPASSSYPQGNYGYGAGANLAVGGVGALDLVGAVGIANNQEVQGYNNNQDREFNNNNNNDKEAAEVPQQEEEPTAVQNEEQEQQDQEEANIDHVDVSSPPPPIPPSEQDGIYQRQEQEQQNADEDNNNNNNEEEGATTGVQNFDDKPASRESQGLYGGY